jgi:hypothetical protein
MPQVQVACKAVGHPRCSRTPAGALAPVGRTRTVASCRRCPRSCIGRTSMNDPLTLPPRAEGGRQVHPVVEEVLESVRGLATSPPSAGPVVEAVGDQVLHLHPTRALWWRPRTLSTSSGTTSTRRPRSECSRPDRGSHTPRVAMRTPSPQRCPQGLEAVREVSASLAVKHMPWRVSSVRFTRTHPAPDRPPPEAVAGVMEGGPGHRPGSLV